MYGSCDSTVEKEPSSVSEATDHIDSDSMSEREEPKRESPDIKYIYRGIPLIRKQKDDSGTSTLLRFSRQSSDVNEEEDVYDYKPEEEWKKTIMVGNDYQAKIPDGLMMYNDVPPYTNKDIKMWDPKSLEESEIEKFLIQAQELLLENDRVMTYERSSIPVRDEEHALYLLWLCNCNVQEALRRCRINVVPPTDAMILWSEEEYLNLENGLRAFGKDFYNIQQNKVRTRSVGELVKFYYLWKKTSRFTIFANKPWLEIEKYSIHPRVKFLDGQKNPGSYRDRYPSPNVHSLLYADPKRQQRVQESMADSHNHTASPSDTLGDLDKQLDCESIESRTSLATSAGGNASESGINCGGSASTLGPEGSSTNGGELSIVKTHSNTSERYKNFEAGFSSVAVDNRVTEVGVIEVDDEVPLPSSKVM